MFGMCLSTESKIKDESILRGGGDHPVGFQSFKFLQNNDASYLGNTDMVEVQLEGWRFLLLSHMSLQMGKKVGPFRCKVHLAGCLA